MNFIDRLENRFPNFGITHLMKYVICINIAGAVLGIIDGSGIFNVQIYYNYLSLDFYAIFHGQVWRLLTWLLYPVYDLSGSSMFVNLIWFAIWAYLYFQFGTVLEQLWGKFRFNLFYFAGIVFVIIVSLVFYLVNVSMYGAMSAKVMGLMIGSAATLEFLNETLFLAYALIFPDATFLLYFLIPIKAKWLGIISGVMLGLQLVYDLIVGSYYGAVLIVGAVINLAIFFVFGRGKQGVSGQIKQKRRKAEFARRARPVEGGTMPGGARHKCAICGRTDIDAPQLEFRYCSKCNGNYEYCSDHLFSHEHIR